VERHGGEPRRAGCWLVAARSKGEAGGAARLVAVGRSRRGDGRAGWFFLFLYFYYTKIVLPQFFILGCKNFSLLIFSIDFSKTLFQKFSRQFYSLSNIFL